MDIINGLNIRENNVQPSLTGTVGGWTSEMFSQGVPPLPELKGVGGTSFKDIIGTQPYKSLTDTGRPNIVGLDSIVKDKNSLERARNKDKNYLGYTLGDDAFNYKGESKFDKYLPTNLYNTEDYNYQNQGFLERAGKATALFADKTLTNFLMNTEGFGAGVVSATRTGNFSAVFNNEFTRQFDKELDYLEQDLPIYAQKEYEDMSWVEKVTTGTFYFKDAPSLLAFTAGAILSSILPMKIVGGVANAGARLAMNSRLGSLVGQGMVSGATAETLATISSKKAGLKALFRSFFNGGDDVVRSISGMSDDALRTTFGLTEEAVLSSNQLRNILIETYKQGLRVSNAISLTGQVGVNAFLASNEGGFEMRDAFKNMLGNYVNEFERVNGRTPTDEEMIPFLKDAQEAANRVYALNLPILMVSNLFTLGKFVGFDAPSLGGLLARRSITQGANGTLSFARHNLARKAVSNLLSYAEAGIAEGVWEEGGQFLASEWMSEHLASKYDPANLREQLSMGEAFYKALDSTLNTKEGQENMGIGFLFGIFMGQTGRFAQRKGGFVERFGAMFGNEYSDNRSNARNVVDLYNKNIEASTSNVMTPQNLLLFRRMNSLSGVASVGEDTVQRRNLAQLVQQSLLRDVGMEDVAIESFNAQIDALEDSKFEELGVPSGRVNEYRDFVKKQYEEQFNISKEVLDIADHFGRSVLSKDERDILEDLGLSVSDYRIAMASELLMGRDALNNVRELSKSLSEHLSKDYPNVNSTLYAMFSDIEDRKDIGLNRLMTINERLKELRKEETNLQNVLVNERGKVQTNPESIQTNAEDKNSKLNSILDEINKLEQERISLETEVSDLKLRILNYVNQKHKSPFEKFLYQDNDGNGFVATEQDLQTYVEEENILKERVSLVLEEINNSDTSEERVKELTQWLEDLKTMRDMLLDNFKYAKVINQNFRIRTDGRYAFEEAKRFTHKTGFLGHRLSSEELKALNEKERKGWEDLEDVIEKYKLKGYDAWNLRANYRILSNFDSIALQKSSNTSLSAEEEVISEGLREKYYLGLVDDSVFFGGIQKRLLEEGEESLTPFLADIYSKNKSRIDKAVDELRIQNGDVMSYGFSTGEKTNTNISRNKPFVEALKETIDNFIETNSRLSKDLVNNVEKPTKEDYSRFKKLHKKKVFGKSKKSFEKDKDEYERLKNKINNWGIISGTVADGVRLSDLIEMYEELNDPSIVQRDDIVEQTEVSVDELLDEEDGDLEWKGTKAGRRFDVAQVYDLAMVSKDKDENFVLHHFGVDALIQEVQKGNPNSNIVVYGVEHVSGNKPLYNSADVLNYSSVEFVIEGANGSITNFKVDIDAQNNLVFKEEVADYLGSLRLMKISSISRNYQPLYRENADGSFEQVRSSFTGGIDTQATKEVSKGDVLTTQIDLNDPYTKMLLENYHKAVSDSSGNKRDSRVVEAKKRLENGMVIQLVDKKGRVVSVLKSNATAQDLKESSTAPAMIKFRKLAIKKLLNSISKNPSSTMVRLGSDFSITVDDIMLGVPNIRIHRNSEGKVSILLSPLSDQAKGKIVDVGYMLNGEIFSKNNTKKTYGKNLLNQYKKSKYSDKKVPLIFIQENGKVVAYPAHLQSKGNLAQDFDYIVDNNEPLEAAVKLNKLLYENGISTQLFGITPKMISERSEEFKMARKQAESHNIYTDPSNWVTDAMTMEDILSEEILVNLDMQGDAFAAPKLRISFGKNIQKVDSEDVEKPDSSGTVSDNLTPPAQDSEDVDVNSFEEEVESRVYEDKDGNKYEDYYSGVNKPFTWKGKTYNVVLPVSNSKYGLLHLLDKDSGEVISETEIMKDNYFARAVNKWAEENVGKNVVPPILILGNNSVTEQGVENKTISVEVEEVSIEEKEEKELEQEVEAEIIEEVIEQMNEEGDSRFSDIQEEVEELEEDEVEETEEVKKLFEPLVNENQSVVEEETESDNEEHYDSREEDLEEILEKEFKETLEKEFEENKENSEEVSEESEDEVLFEGGENVSEEDRKKPIIIKVVPKGINVEIEAFSKKYIRKDGNVYVSFSELNKVLPLIKKYGKIFDLKLSENLLDGEKPLNKPKGGLLSLKKLISEANDEYSQEGYKVIHVSKDKIVASNGYMAIVLGKEGFEKLEVDKTYLPNGMESSVENKSKKMLDSLEKVINNIKSNNEVSVQKISIEKVLPRLNALNAIENKLYGKNKNKFMVSNTDLILQIGEKQTVTKIERLHSVLEAMYNNGEKNVSIYLTEKNGYILQGENSFAVVVGLANSDEFHIREQAEKGFILNLGVDLSSKIENVDNKKVSEADKPTEMLSQVVEKRNKC